MAARAIVGIALGMLFLPVMLLFLDGNLYSWITMITVDFNSFISAYLTQGIATLSVDLIGVFTTSTLPIFLSVFAVNMIIWAIIGMWSGAVERSAGRGIGVAVGIWLGWIIIEVIMAAISGVIGGFLNLLLVQWFSVVIAIIFAAIFGAITKSEEF